MQAGFPFAFKNQPNAVAADDKANLIGDVDMDRQVEEEKEKKRLAEHQRWSLV